MSNNSERYPRRISVRGRATERVKKPNFVISNVERNLRDQCSLKQHFSLYAKTHLFHSATVRNEFKQDITQSTKRSASGALWICWKVNSREGLRELPRLCQVIAFFTSCQFQSWSSCLKRSTEEASTEQPAEQSQITALYHENSHKHFWITDLHLTAS